jgi:hypothetical protein
VAGGGRARVNRYWPRHAASKYAVASEIVIAQRPSLGARVALLGTGAASTDKKPPSEFQA